MKKLICLICIILAVLFVFSGCTPILASPETLIRPPKLTGSDRALQTAFENAVKDKGSVILKAPLNGSYRSAYVLFDYDDDGTNEAIVFYSPESDEMAVNMNILDYVNGEWVSVNDIAGDGSDVYSIEFQDLNADGVAEILVSYSVLDSKSNKRLSVYSRTDYKSLDFTSVAMESYTNMYTVDIDMDGQLEIALAYLNSTSEEYTSNIRFLKMDQHGEQIYTFAETSLYSENTGFSSITSDEHDGVCYMYIDEIVSGSTVTEIVYWDNENECLVKPVDVDILTLNKCPTSRIIAVNCRDINNDGLIEIPTASQLNDSKIVSKYNEELNQQINLITWNRYDDGEFINVYEYIRNSADGYIVELPEDMLESLSVVFDADRHIASFYIMSDDNEKILLFTVYSVIQSAVDVNIKGFYLKSGSVYSYYCDMTDECYNFGLNRRMIAKSLIVSDGI